MPVHDLICQNPYSLQLSSYSDFLCFLCREFLTFITFRQERGSTAKNLTVAEFKVDQEKEKLAALETKVEVKKEQLSALQQKTKTAQHTALTFSEINDMSRKNLRGKMELEPSDLENLKSLARVGLTAPAKISDLKRKLKERTDDATVL